MEKFFLIASYPKSILKFRKELILQIKNSNIEVHVAAPFSIDTQDDESFLKNIGVKTHQIPLNRRGINPFKDLYAFISLFALLKKIRPKYVFSYTIKPIIYGTIASYLCGVKNRFSMVTGLGTVFIDNNINRLQKYTSLLIMQLYKIALKLSSKVIFQNKDDLETLYSLNILSKKTIVDVVNGSGVNIEEFSHAPFPKNINFLFIGRYIKSKGIEEYFGAATYIKEKYKNINFTIAGWVEDGDKITQKDIDEISEKGIISNLGFLEDVKPAIKNSSVFVLPSYREGTPRSVLEAMAMGRAIITTNAPGCKETVIDNYNGFLVEVGSTGELIKAIEKFITHDVLISEMGKKSLELVAKKYNVKKVNDIMLQIMDIPNTKENR